MKLKPNTIFSEAIFRNYILMTTLVFLFSSPLLFLDKEIPTFWLNEFHSPFLDQLFYYITYLGDGLILIPVLLFLLFKSYVWAGFFAAFTVIEAILVQLVLKKGFFAHLDRPSAYIENFNELHQVAGNQMHGLHTFPSGHTQTIFLIITFIVFAAKKSNSMSIALILIAITTGLSRVYLLQHFFIDIWFGALIGIGIPVLIIYLLQKFNKFPISQKSLVKK